MSISHLFLRSSRNLLPLLSKIHKAQHSCIPVAKEFRVVQLGKEMRV